MDPGGRSLPDLDTCEKIVGDKVDRSHTVAKMSTDGHLFKTQFSTTLVSSNNKTLHHYHSSHCLFIIVSASLLKPPTYVSQLVLLLFATPPLASVKEVSLQVLTLLVRLMFGPSSIFVLGMVTSHMSLVC
jgi:hypothetical protein